MTDAPTIGIALAFMAGLLSFLSPCVLPLIPSYITFISGVSLDDVSQSRRTAFVHSLLFVLGFTIIFLALGATATTLGRALGYYRDWIGRIGGALLIVFGLYMMGVFNIAAFQREKRFHIANKPAGYFGTVLVGLAFGAGWTPCIGPILGGVLTYTASSAGACCEIAGCCIHAQSGCEQCSGGRRWFSIYNCANYPGAICKIYSATCPSPC